ncbi:aminotransferase class III-fold pyridoxal phosphate-dependent enzyme [Candidatus Poribacteria bacterium]|nr:aminotransferase class III-fold pyridoxal phosphate-dependent enzyme [Candidatus Poribacteria bacterium]
MIDLKSIPVTKEDLDRYEVENLFHSWSYQPAKSPMRVVSTKGTRFTNEEGRTFLDFSSCFVSHNIGHQDPRVLDALTEQAKKLCSFAPNFSTRPRATLAKMVAEITPGDLSRTFFCLSGTEANEAAIKICHQYTGRRKIISRYSSYHGGTSTSMTLSSGDPRSWAQVPGGVERLSVPLPYCYRCMFGQKYPECDLRCVTYIDQVIELEGGGDKVAGILFEPVTGANGIIVPPAEYFPRLREICDKWGVLMIADEVMTGFGRTGKWFAMDHWNVVPDIMTMAKGITAAYMPMGATVVRKHIGDRFKEQFFSHGATYAGHALACATAIRVVRIYQEDNLIENAAKMGKYLLEKALELKDKHPSVGDVRGLGLFVGLELVKNKKTREPLIPVAAKIRPESNPKVEVGKRLVELGMIAMAANPSNIVAMAPPLIITKGEIDEGIGIMDKALEVADAHAEK